MVIVGSVRLHLQAVADQVFSDGYGRLVIVLVAYQLTYLFLWEKGRVTQGDLPFLGEEITGL